MVPNWLHGARRLRSHGALVRDTHLASQLRTLPPGITESVPGGDNKKLNEESRRCLSRDVTEEASRERAASTPPLFETGSQFGIVVYAAREMEPTGHIWDGVCAHLSFFFASCWLSVRGDAQK